MDFVDRSFRALSLTLMVMCSACQPARPPISLADLAEHVDGSDAIRFRSDTNIDARTLFETYGSLFNLPPDSTMRLVEDRAGPWKCLP